MSDAFDALRASIDVLAALRAKARVATALGDAFEQARPKPTSPPRADFLPPSLSYCLLCGERKNGLIMASEMGICRDCAAQVVDVCRR